MCVPPAPGLTFNVRGPRYANQKLTGPFEGWPGTDVCLLEPCSGENKYNIDAFGLRRGADGTWERGAFESGDPPLGLAAPSRLRVR